MELLAQYPAIAGFAFGLAIGGLLFYFFGYENGHIDGFDAGMYRKSLREKSDATIEEAIALEMNKILSIEPLKVRVAKDSLIRVEVYPADEVRAIANSKKK